MSYIHAMRRDIGGFCNTIYLKTCTYGTKCTTAVLESLFYSNINIILGILPFRRKPCKYLHTGSRKKLCLNTWNGFDAIMKSLSSIMRCLNNHVTYWTCIIWRRTSIEKFLPAFDMYIEYGWHWCRWNCCAKVPHTKPSLAFIKTSSIHNIT